MRSTKFSKRIATACSAAMLVLLLVGAAMRASAADMDKSKFKEGCEAGKGSYVENNDGSFQCNLRSGGTIKCPDTKSQCSYTAKLSHNLVMKGLRSGDFKMVAAPTKTTPKPTEPAAPN
jgi:hypothetical protein